MNLQVNVKALISHIVKGDGQDKCRICMGDTSEGQVYLGDTVMMDGERPVTLAELLETITGVEVSEIVKRKWSQSQPTYVFLFIFRIFCEERNDAIPALK